MKILFLTENFPPEVNAIASRVYERALHWVKDGHEVTVITSFPNFPQGKIYPGYRQRLIQRETISGISVVRVPTYVARNEGVLLRTFDFVTFMVSACCAAPFVPRSDVVVATSPQFFCAIAGWIISIFKRRPFVLELGDLWPASIAAVGAMKHGTLLRMIERLELFLYRRSAAVVTLTAAFKQNLVSRHIDAGKIFVVINGVDLDRFAPRPRDTELAARTGLNGCFVVGYVGTHGMAHDLANAVRAAALLRERVPHFRLLFVGDGATKRGLQQLAAELQLGNVLFVEPQPKDAMPRWWSICDMALIHLKDDPVFAEVIPSKIFESMAMGLPQLFCGPRGEGSEIVERAGSGVCVPPAQPELLADAIEMLSKDLARCALLAERSVAAAPAFSRRRQADDFLAVLAKVIGARQ